MGQRYRTCTRKKPRTLFGALRYAWYVWRRERLRLYTYRCSYCGYWHMTKWRKPRARLKT